MNDPTTTTTAPLNPATLPDPTTPPDPTTLPDPRPAFAAVGAVMADLVRRVDDDQLGAPTPCDEFDVNTLLDHLVYVVRGAGAVGRLGRWGDIEQVRIGDSVADYATTLDEELQAATAAWVDGAKLDRLVEMPWGTLPGAAIVATYTGELAVHSWDLATATGNDLRIDDHLLTGALFAYKVLPAEGRDDPAVPFGAVVDPGPNASVLHQLAGWTGRPVV